MEHRETVNDKGGLMIQSPTAGSHEETSYSMVHR